MLGIGCFKGSGLNFTGNVGSSGGSSGGGSGGGGGNWSAFPKVFSTSATEYFNTGFPTTDGGIILAGHYSSTNDALFIKINSNGVTSWKKLGSIGTECTSIFELGGFYYAAGTTNNQNGDYFLSKLNQDGTTNKIIYFDNFVGNPISIPLGQSIIYSYANKLLKFNENLNYQLALELEDNNANLLFIRKMVPFIDGNISYVFFTSEVSNNGIVGRIDCSGSVNVDPNSIASYRTVNGFSGSSVKTAICNATNADNADILVTLYSSNNAVIMKLDKNLQLISYRSYTHDNTNFSFSISSLVPTLDGKYLLVLTSGDGNHPDLVVLLNQDLTINSRVELNMVSNSAFPVLGGYIFAGKLKNSPDAVVMSLDLSLNPSCITTIGNNYNYYNFSEGGSYNITLSPLNPNNNIIPHSSSIQNTPTTDANLQEDNTCRTNWY